MGGFIIHGEDEWTGSLYIAEQHVFRCGVMMYRCLMVTVMFTRVQGAVVRV